MAKMRISKIIKDALDELTENSIPWKIVNNSGKLNLLVDGQITGMFSANTDDGFGNAAIYNIRAQIRQRQKEILAKRGVKAKEPKIKVKISRKNTATINKTNRALQKLGIKVDHDFTSIIKENIRIEDEHIARRTREQQAKREYWHRIKQKRIKRPVQQFTMADAMRIAMEEKE